MVSFNYRLIYDVKGLLRPRGVSAAARREVILYREKKNALSLSLARDLIRRISRLHYPSVTPLANYQRERGWLLCLQLEIFPTTLP